MALKEHPKVWVTPAWAGFDPRQRHSFEGLLENPQDWLDFLTPEERAEYEACKQSVVDARRLANQIEGQIFI